jgi:hypothetical protein
MTPAERELIKRLCSAIENLTYELGGIGNLTVTGLDEVWGSLGHVGAEVHDLTEELKGHRTK